MGKRTDKRKHGKVKIELGLNRFGLACVQWRRVMGRKEGGGDNALTQQPKTPNVILFLSQLRPFGFIFSII